jgi:tryptophan synthase beta chain
LIEAVAVAQIPVFEAAVLFARQEGILPAPESSHAIRVAVDEALKCKQNGEKKVILFNLSGHGHFDLTAYNKYLSGQLEDYDFPEEAIATIRQRLPQVEMPA